MKIFFLGYYGSGLASVRNSGAFACESHRHNIQGHVTCFIQPFSIFVYLVFAGCVVSTVYTLDCTSPFSFSFLLNA